MQAVPLVTLPNQELQVQLNGQGVQLDVYQTAYGLFIDVFVSGKLIIGGVLCRNGTFIVRNSYLGFLGDFVFTDTQGTNDPDYTGLGTRYFLIYFLPSELPPPLT